MITIIKYNAGNIRSVQNALNRLGVESMISDNPEKIQEAERVIFPGVGEANTAMRYLRDKELDKVIISLKQPVLGICLGLQLLCQTSEENNTKCMGIFEAKVRKFPNNELVPQMGWNNFSTLKGDLYKGVEIQEDVYYVHSYYAEICENTQAVCKYSVDFSAGMQKDNFYATQFHPEKSAEVGEKILKNFLVL